MNLRSSVSIRQTVRAKMAALSEEHRWSSYRGYVRARRAVPWIVQAGEPLFKLADKTTTIFEVLTRDRIVSTESCSADTS